MAKRPGTAGKSKRGRARAPVQLSLCDLLAAPHAGEDTPAAATKQSTKPRPAAADQTGHRQACRADAGRSGYVSQHQACDLKELARQGRRARLREARRALDRLHAGGIGGLSRASHAAQNVNCGACGNPPTRPAACIVAVGDAGRSGATIGARELLPPKQNNIPTRSVLFFAKGKTFRFSFSRGGRFAKLRIADLLNAIGRRFWRRWRRRDNAP